MQSVRIRRGRIVQPRKPKPHRQLSLFPVGTRIRRRPRGGKRVKVIQVIINRTPALERVRKVIDAHGPTGRVQLSAAKIAQFAACHLNEAKRAIKALVAEGWIKITQAARSRVARVMQIVGRLVVPEGPKTTPESPSLFCPRGEVPNSVPSCISPHPSCIGVKESLSHNTLPVEVDARTAIVVSEAEQRGEAEVRQAAEGLGLGHTVVPGFGTAMVREFGLHAVRCGLRYVVDFHEFRSAVTTVGGMLRECLRKKWWRTLRAAELPVLTREEADQKNLTVVKQARSAEAHYSKVFLGWRETQKDRISTNVDEVIGAFVGPEKCLRGAAAYE